jgi:hypothetical protein
MRASNRLSALEVKQLEKPGRYADGGGLYLQVSKWRTRAWVFRYMLNGRARTMGLGSVDTFTLKEARERARAARQLLADGIDPIEARDEQRQAALAETAKRITFKDAAEQYIAAHRAGWKSAMCGHYDLLFLGAPSQITRTPRVVAAGITKYPRAPHAPIGRNSKQQPTQSTCCPLDFDC